MSIELVMPFNLLVLCYPLLLLPSVFPSLRVFSNELVLCIRWPKYWSFSCSISPSNEYSGLISFRIYWFWGDPFNIPSYQLYPIHLAILKTSQRTLCKRGSMDGSNPSRAVRWQLTRTTPWRVATSGIVVWTRLSVSALSFPEDVAFSIPCYKPRIKP